MYALWLDDYVQTDDPFWWQAIRIIKETLLFGLLWLFISLQVPLKMLGLYWLLWMGAALIITLAILPVLQSPLKFIRYIWERYIPDGDEEEFESEKRKGLMRLTDDGELEEVIEDQVEYYARQKRT